ncbi:hypothetical protein DPMN_095541 [Dreissena polymorpha]|uniref:Uncharacterized protein n=1 Tax=Dreissena polymorpha TaxID=45954 RepID=A0A9D4R3N3_DREPO|nr:hypothetical protein DPMN_095541 [Dreissena polymorpha]
MVPWNDAIKSQTDVIPPRIDVLPPRTNKNLVRNATIPPRTDVISTADHLGVTATRVSLSVPAVTPRS